MTIAIDASRAVNESAGIGRYTKEIVQHLLEIDQKNRYILIFSYFRKSPQKEKIIAGFKKPNVTIKTLKIPGGLKEKLWRIKMPFYEKFIGRSDVFFAPSFFEINAGLKIPQVVTIHDLTTFIYPEHRGIEVSKRLSTCAKEAAKLSQKIITMSRATAADAQKYLNIKEKKIDVVYPGLSDLGKPNNLAKNLKPSSFILYVGTIEPRKNLIGLFKAYSLLPLVLQEKYPLVVVGAQGWNTGESYDAFNALKLEGKVKFLGFISDASLAKLYESCAVFVYPSLYEGFGLPVLEALSFGAPVVTSNISSLPEVAGDAAVLINPEDPKEICAGIQKLLEHNHEAMDIRQKGKKQSQKFTWEKSARETLKVLKEAANV